MDSTTLVFIAITVIFVLAMAVYLLIAFMWPEWVGITGKVALEVQRSHREGAPTEENEFIDALQTKTKNS